MLYRTHWAYCYKGLPCKIQIKVANNRRVNTSAHHISILKQTARNRYSRSRFGLGRIYIWPDIRLIAAKFAGLPDTAVAKTLNKFLSYNLGWAGYFFTGYPAD